MTIDDVCRRSDVAVVCADHSGTIVSINDRFKELYAWTAADLIGRPISTIMPTRLRDAHHLGFSRFIATGIATILERPLDLVVLARDRREVDAEVCIIAEQSDGRWAFAATIRPSEIRQ